MISIETTDVRSAGNLPAGITDGQISPHIPAAVETVAMMIGYWGFSDDEKTEADASPFLKSAAACLTLSRLATISNMFYISGASAPSRGIEPGSFVYLEPSEAEKLSLYWKNEAARMIELYKTKTSASGVVVNII